MITRRSFMGALLAASVAPAVVRAASLMPVRVLDSGIVVPLPGYGGANALISLMPEIYAAMDIVSREVIVFIK